MISVRTLCLVARPAALVLGSLTIVALATPASARPAHGASRHYHQHQTRHVRHHEGRPHFGRHVARRGGALRSAAQPAATETTSRGFSGFGSDLVAEARRYLGGNPTGRSSLWCARFLNLVLQRSGHTGTGSDLASSFAHYGKRVSGPQVGAIAVMSRRGGGHVGVVSGVDAKGNPIVVSGNHGHRVAEAVYPRSRVYAYVLPAS